MRRPPRSQLEIGQRDGKLTDANPIDRNALLRVAIKVQRTGMLALPDAVRLYTDTRRNFKRALQSQYLHGACPRLCGSLGTV